MQIKQPIIFAKLPIVFFIVGNHGDISHFLQDLVSQMEIMIQKEQVTMNYCDV